MPLIHVKAHLTLLRYNHVHEIYLPVWIPSSGQRGARETGDSREQQRICQRAFNRRVSFTPYGARMSSLLGGQGRCSPRAATVGILRSCEAGLPPNIYHHPLPTALLVSWTCPTFPSQVSVSLFSPPTGASRRQYHRDDQRSNTGRPRNHLFPKNPTC